MSTSDWIGIIGVAAAIMATTIGSSWNIATNIASMSAKLDILWQVHIAKSKSPISLNDYGEEMLLTSNIGAFANLYYDEILQHVRGFKPENAYQTQEILISIVGRYKKKDEHRLKLQDIAFQSGYDVDSLLLVAALSIRDRVVKDMGFAIDNINNI